MQELPTITEQPLLVLGLVLVWWRRSQLVGMAAMMASGIARCAHHALTRADYGWDMLMYCGALHSADEGQSPYLVANIARYARTTLSYAYPMFTAQFARPACDDAYRPHHLAFFVLLLAASMVLLHRLRGVGRGLADHVYGATLVLTGFVGTMWVLLSGNLAIVEFLFLAMGLLALSHNRDVAGGVCLGMLAALKLSFVFMLLAVVLFHPLSAHRARLRLLAAMAVGALLVHAFSVISHPGFYWDYWRQVLGVLDSHQHTPLREMTGGRSDPSLLLVVRQALLLSGQRSGALAICVTLLMVVPVGVLWWRALRVTPLSGLQRMAAGVLVLSLYSPRLKPYTFLLLTVPLWIVSAGMSHRVRAAVLTLACGVAMASYWDGFHTQYPVVGLLRGTMQVWALYAVVLMLGLHLIAAANRLARRAPQAPDEAEG